MKLKDSLNISEATPDQIKIVANFVMEKDQRE